jgi:UDP-N-acetylmuramate dehydrogenase
MNDAIRAAESILRAACGDRIRTAFPLAPLTTFRIGGPAALYLEPGSEDDLAAASAAIRETRIPHVVLGKGSNVLVADDGFPGLVLRLGRGFRWAGRDGERLSAGGAMPLPALAGVALHHELAGLEFGVAIPGSLGGAVRMNAGAHDGEMARVLERIDLYRLEAGIVDALAARDAGLAYRTSALPPDAVVIGAVAVLRRDGGEAIRARMDEARAWRRATQPIAEPNCGSVFANPTGDRAARLIDGAGGKELRVGGARVSAKHANFIIAEPGATAADVLALIEAIQGTVERATGIRLEPEVRLVGRFDRVHR